METVAIYTEETIRIYGITRRGPQALLTFRFKNTTDEFHLFTGVVEKIQPSVKTFEQFLISPDSVISPDSDQNFSAYLVLSEKDAASAVSVVENSVESGFDPNLKIVAPVNSLFLHGPHFQDRYGIADAIFQAIQQKGIVPLACSCTGTSMYIVLAPEVTEACYQYLKDTFLIPSCP